MTHETVPSGAFSGSPGGVELVRQGPLLRWLARLLLLGAVALMVTYLVDLASAVRAAGSSAAWQAVVAIAAVLYTAPMAVVVWHSTSKRYPRTGTVRDLSWSLTPAERRTVARALLRGEPIGAGHQAYAIATTAAARRIYCWSPTLPIYTWGQAIDESVREYGSGFFWFQAGTAAVISVVFCGAVALQLRHERSARALAG